MSDSVSFQSEVSWQSLNDSLAKGPDMLNNLLGILVRFREVYYAIVRDISKM